MGRGRVGCLLYVFSNLQARQGSLLFVFVKMKGAGPRKGKDGETGDGREGREMELQDG